MKEETTEEVTEETPEEVSAVEATEEIDTSETVNETDQESDEESDTAPEIKALRRESAKWRTKYGDTRTELESATTRLDELQRAQVESMLRGASEPDRRQTVGRSSAIAATIWDLGKTVADFRDDDGNIDTDKVSQARDLLEDRFPSNKPPLSVEQIEDLQPGAAPYADSRRPSWSKALGGKRQ